MTGDGLKELVVVTTRGVQVRLDTVYISENTICVFVHHVCGTLQVLQADLASVKEVTLQRLKSLVSALPNLS